MNPRGTINRYRSHDREYLRYSWREGRRKTRHRHIGPIDDPVAIGQCEQIRELQAAGKGIEEILIHLKGE